jgi:hypothetical protein
LAQIDSDFLQYLLDYLIALLLKTNIHGIVNSVVHHLLPLFHDVVLALKFHGDPLESRQIHSAVHATERHRCAFHSLHHLLVGAIRLEAGRCQSERASFPCGGVKLTCRRRETFCS